MVVAQRRPPDDEAILLAPRRVCQTSLTRRASGTPSGVRFLRWIATGGVAALNHRLPSATPVGVNSLTNPCDIITPPEQSTSVDAFAAALGAWMRLRMLEGFADAVPPRCDAVICRNFLSERLLRESRWFAC